MNNRNATRGWGTGIVWVPFLIMLGIGPAVSAGPPPGKRIIPWDGAALVKAPPVHPTTERPAQGMRAFFYEGAEIKGKPTWVFAYYAAPEGKPPAGGWPAVVCAHGGGGTAFPAWVKEWNKHGYAAIAMDLEGHLPGGRFFGVEGNFPPDQAHENAGPKRNSWFGDIALPDKEQWFYHAVADVIRANSLLRSYPEINPKKIGLTGISWWGTIVSTVAGVDSRFAFVVPVYGGGFIHKHDMTPEQYRIYNTKWDPSAYLPYAKMPMLWVSSFTEPVFPIDLFSKSATTAAGTSILCIRPWLIHGHGFGWEEAWEIYAFADSVVKGGPPKPRLGRPQVNPKDGLVHAKATNDLKNAALSFTTGGGAWKDRKWANIPCTLGKDEVVSTKPLPADATAYVINGNDKRDGCVNSEVIVVKP
jgi:dienelactone hydrolase